MPGTVNRNRREIWLSAILIAVTALAAYSNLPRSDLIHESAALARRSLDGISALAGRPVLGLSFAVCRRLFGNTAWSFRFVNLAVHIGAALLLFGVTGRTASRWREKTGPSATGLALAIALLWVVHPLTTESVTYSIGRASSLMGLFYLLAVYCAIRAMDRQHRTKENDYAVFTWCVTSVVVCGLGMATNATMVSAPIVILLYDCVFVAESLETALCRRRWLYVGLASTWLIPLLLLAAMETQPFDWHTTPPLRYAVTQSHNLLRYLARAFWPHPLILSYRPRLLHIGPDTMGPPIIVASAAVFSLWGLVKRHWAGFLGAAALIIMAPTSSFFPLRTTDLFMEQRFYLPLAAVAALAASACGLALRRVAGPARSRGWCFFLVASAVVVLSLTTMARNRDYSSPICFWGDNAAKRPSNEFARLRLGELLMQRGMVTAAMRQYDRAIAVEPNSAEAYQLRGEALMSCGRAAEAAESFKDALRVDPLRYHALCGWGVAVAAMGRPDKAVEMFEQAARIEPACALAFCEWGNARQTLGDRASALTLYRRGLAAEPNSDLANFSVGRILSEDYDPAAGDYFRRALEISPNNHHAHVLLADWHVRFNHPWAALEHYAAAFRRDPEYVLREEQEWGQEFLDASLPVDDTQARRVHAILRDAVVLARSGEGERAAGKLAMILDLRDAGDTMTVADTLQRLLEAILADEPRDRPDANEDETDTT